MNSNETSELPAVRPCFICGVGTLGTESCTFDVALVAEDLARAGPGRAKITPELIRAIDTDAGSAGMARRLSAAGEPATLGADELFLVPAQKHEDLIRAFRQDARMRNLEKRLSIAPGTDTRRGGGTVPVVAFAAGVAALDQIELWIGSSLERLRHSPVVADCVRRGQRVDLRARTPLIFIVNGGGATGTGLFPLLSILARRHAERLGLDLQIVLLVAAPRPSDGGSFSLANANLVGMVRQVALSHIDPSRAIIHAFGGNDVQAVGPLADRVVLFGVSNGLVADPDRNAVAFAMAMAAHQMATGPAAVVDSHFRDSEQDILRIDPILGPRIFGRFGHSMIVHDVPLRDQMLLQRGRMLLASRLRNGDPSFRSRFFESLKQ